MANKKEIEVKLRIDDADFFSQMVSEMELNYEKLEEVYQHDVYYSPITENYMEEEYPYKWFRLRYLSDGGSEICFKHFYPEGAERHLYCNEYQTRVSESEAITKILSELGMQIIAEVEKRRITYRYGRYLVSFDIVKNLGNFVEIEVENVKFDEIKERKLLDSILEELRLSTYPVDLRGYPYLIYSLTSQK